MASKELIEIKFRLADGSDIGPNKYTPTTTVGSLKEKIIAQWPKDKDSGPKTINDVKLINAGRILENNKTLGESRLPVAEVPGGVITMHVVVRPPMNEKARGTARFSFCLWLFVALFNKCSDFSKDKLQDDSLKKGGCACTIL